MILYFSCSDCASELTEDGTPSKVSCPNEKAATPPQSSSGGGVNNADGDSNSAADNLMSELPNETLDSILADAVKVSMV